MVCVRSACGGVCSRALCTGSDLRVVVCVPGPCVRGGCGVGFDPSALHVGDELVRDLRQHVFSEPRHAQHVVPRPVHVIAEGDELRGRGVWHFCDTGNTVLINDFNLD